MAEGSTYWPPAEWPETTMALRLGKMSFFASLRRISSVKSNEVNFSWLVAVPPERQLSPAQLQLTSLGANWSRQLPALEARCGAMTMVSSSAPLRNAAARAVRQRAADLCPALHRGARPGEQLGPLLRLDGGAAQVPAALDVETDFQIEPGGLFERVAVKLAPAIAGEGGPGGHHAVVLLLAAVGVH